MLSLIKLDTKEGIDNYKLLYKSLNISAPHFLIDYINFFGSGLNNLICFSYLSTKTNAVAIMPGYLNTIVIGTTKTNYHDFITPYGYTGPLYSKDITDTDIIDFWESLDTWYKENNVITEFVRFNLFGNQKNYSGTVSSTLLNVKGCIINEETQFNKFDRKVRKNVNRAKRENLYSKIYYKNIDEKSIAEFYGIYIKTMQRKGASKKFLYDFDKFERFVYKNEEYIAVCTIYFGETAISSELLLVSDDSIYSFLGGTNDSYFNKRPNDFLKIQALNWARNMGKKYYILGGGYGFDDGIFKYKKSFFPNDVINFYTGRKIINEIVYQNLMLLASNFRKESGLEPFNLEKDSFFPLYNKPD